MISFFVEGPPMPLQRARKGKGGHWYTPEESRAYKERVALEARGAVARHDRQLLAGFEKLGAWCRDSRFSVFLTVYDDRKTYDLDNVVKAVLDGVTKAGTVWTDDRRVDRITVVRRPMKARTDAVQAGGGLRVDVEPFDYRNA